MKNSLLVKNIGKLVTCDSEDRVLENVNLLIEDGVIKAISQDTYEAETIVDGSHMLVYPGLINTHHHLYQIFTRNLPQVQGLELFPWLKVLYELWKNLDSEIIYQTSLVGIGELLKTGCTTIFDHHYVFPETAVELIDTQFRAANTLGARFHASRGSMSLSKKDGGLPPDTVVQTLDEILKDSQNSIEKYHDPRPFSMQQVALAPCSPFSVTEDLMIESAKLARSYGVRLHTHLAETLDEERFILERFKMRPLAYMESLDWVGSDVWYAHGIHFNDAELDLLAKTQTGVAHCPISNMKLSSGVCRVPDLLKRKVPLGLAVDGSASNDGSNLLEELRVAYLLHRLTYGDKAPSAYDVLKIATNGGAKVLGRNDIGALEVGMAGDLFMIDSRKLELIGTQLDPKSFLGTVGYKGAVDITIVNGKIVVKDQKLVTIDEEKLVASANALITDFLNR